VRVAIVSHSAEFAPHRVIKLGQCIDKLDAPDMVDAPPVEYRADVNQLGRLSGYRFIGFIG
jgi:hypothetical protein